MWATFGEFASKHGYGIWNNYDCTGYTEPLVDISTGPGGQLNKAFLSNRGISVDTLAAGIAPTVPRAGGPAPVATQPTKPGDAAKAGNTPVESVPASQKSQSLLLQGAAPLGATSTLADTGDLQGRPKRRPGLQRVGKVGLVKPAWADKR